MSYAIHPPPWEPVHIPSFVTFRINPHDGPHEGPTVLSQRQHYNLPNRSRPRKQWDSTPTTFNMRIPEARSEPNLNIPINTTIPTPAEAPSYWFVPITHKEKLAIYTMEQIPDILNEKSRARASSDPTNHFDPTFVTYLDRMKVNFSSAMVLARQEAVEKETDVRSDQPIYNDEVMCSSEVDAFLAGIEEVRHPLRDNLVLFRRYWRPMARPGFTFNNVGGIVSTRAFIGEPGHPTPRDDFQLRWQNVPKELLAEFVVVGNGSSTIGRWITIDEDERAPRKHFEKGNKKNHERGNQKNVEKHYGTGTENKSNRNNNWYSNKKKHSSQRHTYI